MEDGDEIDAFLSQVGGEHERRHDEWSQSGVNPVGVHNTACNQTGNMCA
jgi:hypothetical protein